MYMAAYKSSRRHLQSAGEQQGERGRSTKTMNDTESRREATMWRCQDNMATPTCTGRTWQNSRKHIGMAVTSMQPRWRSSTTSTLEASRLPKPPCMDGRDPGRRLGSGVPAMMPQENKENKEQGEHNTHTNAADREAASDNKREVGACKPRVHPAAPENNNNNMQLE
jgi:hypothetical protein